MDNREKINFVRGFTNSAVISATSRWVIDIETLKNEMGNNYNTLIIYNESSEIINVEFNQDSNNFIPLGAGGTLSISAEDQLIFTQISIYNTDASAQIEIGEMHVTIGRTGVKS